MIEKINQIASAANVSAKRANGFRKRSHLDVHASVNFEVINGSATVAAENAGGVGVIHHHDGAILLREVAQSRQRANVAVHREYAVSDQKFLARLVFYAGQFGVSIGNVLMFEYQNLCPGKARSVNDRSMIKLVRNNEIFFSQHR